MTSSPYNVWRKVRQWRGNVFLDNGASKYKTYIIYVWPSWAKSYIACVQLSEIAMEEAVYTSSDHQMRMSMARGERGANWPLSTVTS